MTTLAHSPVPSAPVLPTSAEQHFVLHNVSWEEYVAIGHLFTDRPGLRITFDRGTLEFMTTSPRHERYKYWLGRFVDIMADELQKPYVPGGSMTFQADELERGFEPDDC